MKTLTECFVFRINRKNEICLKNQKYVHINEGFVIIFYLNNFIDIHFKNKKLEILNSTCIHQSINKI